jgi:citrate-Mg2+:H+ or citrate-Ca2+:H+ symporter, CitMHS family
LFTLTTLSYLMVFTFVGLIIAKKMSPVAALAIVPIVFAMIAGVPAKSIAKFVFTGMQSVFPMIILVVFAVILFGVFTDSGMFDPFIRTVITRAKGDPARIIFGASLLLVIIGLSGDATVSVMICAYILMPIYRKMGINPYLLGVQLGAINIVCNLVPWGPPVIRLQAVFGLSTTEIFNPVIPAIGVTLIGVLASFWYRGLKERKSLGHVELDEQALQQMIEAVTGRNADAKRPKMIWFNIIFFILVLAALIKEVLPSPLLFFVAAIIALMVNYPSPEDQKKRIAAHADSIAALFTIIASAGIMLGILNGAKMADAISYSLVEVIPANLGAHIPIFTALVGLPGLYFIQGDAYFFGIIPIIAKTAAAFGVSSVSMAHAALTSYAFHAVTPTAAPMYLTLALLELEYGKVLRTYLPWGLGISASMIGVSLLTGSFPL